MKKHIKNVLIIIGCIVLFRIVLYYVLFYPFTEEHDKHIAERFYKKNQNLFLEVQECILNIPEEETIFLDMHIVCNEDGINYMIRDSWGVISSGSVEKDISDSVSRLCSKFEDKTRGAILRIIYSREENSFRYLIGSAGMLIVSADGNSFSFEGIIDD